MEALPYYKWHWQDYRANRRVQRMPWQARGPYRELLDEFWAEGSLPLDHAELADICAMTLEEFEQWWIYISPCWEERNGKLYNAKMDNQRTTTDTARVAMKIGGKAGGKVSNSSTRAKASEAYPKPTLEVPEAMPDIEEKRREEKTREEKSTEHTTHPIRPEMITRGVLVELCLSGRDLAVVIEEVCRSELARGALPGDIRDGMTAAWRDYEANKPNLTFTRGAAKFFGEGDWRNRDGWPWRENGTNKRNSETKYEQAAREAAESDRPTSDYAGRIARGR